MNDLHGLEALDHGFELDVDSYPLVRLRLADELHRRAYHDVGVEVSPGSRLSGSYVISTPHCRQGETVLGELSWSVDRLRLGPPGRRFENWQQFRAHAFDALGVERWRTRRHLGCFHRRGKARYDLTFAVMCRLLTGTQPAVWALSTDTVHPDDVRFGEMIAANGGTPPPGRPPRFLAVTCCGRPLAALRGDGWTVTPGGVLVLDELWWRGMDTDQQADEIRRLAGHEHPSDASCGHLSSCEPAAQLRP